MTKLKSPPNSTTARAIRDMNRSERARIQALLRHRYTPNPELLSAAGDAATAIAKICPRPHHDYFEAAPSRRRLLTLVARRGEGLELLDRKVLLDTLTKAQSKVVVEQFFPAVPALASVLGKLVPCRDWSDPDDQRLMAVLVDPMGRQVLQHLPRIDPQVVKIVHCLPPELRHLKLVRLLGSWDVARIVGLVGQHAARVTDKPLAHLATRLDRARSLAHIEAMLRDDCLDEPFDQPLARDPRFVRMHRRSEMISLSKDLNNCLAKDGYITRAAEGKYAYFRWNGQEPAAVELFRNPTIGWRLNEFNGRGNHALSPSAQAELLGALRAHAVRVDEPAPLDLLDQLKLLALRQERRARMAAEERREQVQQNLNLQSHRSSRPADSDPEEHAEEHADG